MNMEAYQKFQKILKISSANVGKESHRINVKNDIKYHRQKPDNQGHTDEEIINNEMRKTESMFREVEMSMHDSQIFEISDKHKFLLMLTTPPKFEEKELWNQVRLPFPEIFIDVSFQEEQIQGWENEINGLLIKELLEYKVIKNKKGEYESLSLYGLNVFMSGISKERIPFVDSFKYPIISSNEDIKMDIIYQNKKEANFIKQFITNFLLFLKSREVVIIDTKRPAKNKERRKKKGLIPLPDSKVVTLTGEIKRYVNSLSMNDFKGVGRKYGYQFWVKGHYRQYKSDRYKNKKGQIKWINPFKKGEGIEVRKTYRVVPDNLEK